MSKVIESKDQTTNANDESPDESINHTSELQAENEELRQELEKERSTKNTGRRILVGILILIGCLSFAFANVANWARDTLTDTDTWVETVGPLSQNPVIVGTISTAVVEGISEELNLSAPETPGFLVTLGILEKPIVELVQDLLVEGISTVLLSDEFNEIWVGANEIIHGALITVLSGDNSYIYAENGVVYLDFNELINELLSSIGLGELSIFEVGGDIARFPLMESETLALLQRGLRFLNNLAILSLVLMILSFVGAIALSKWRRNTVIAIGVGSAIVMLLSFIVFAVGEALLLDSILDPAFYDFVSELVDALTNGLIGQTVLFMILGVVVAAVAWFTRPKAVGVEG